MKLKKLFFCLLYFIVSLQIYAQNSDVMMQGFNWVSNSNTNGWYTIVNAKVAEMKAAGINTIWLPPPGKAASNEGYLPTEYYNLNTKYGTQAQLQTLISSLHSNGMKALADIVINHRVGNTNYADFVNPSWGCWAVCNNDEWSGRCGGNDTGVGYAAARDIDHNNVTVQNDIIAWMKWLKNTIGFDGWRYDLVGGYSGAFTKKYNDATLPYFSVGEFYDGNRQNIQNWVDATQQSSTAFDFATKAVLQDALNNNNLGAMNIGGKAPGLIGWSPSKSVTFIDNHDTGSTQNLWPFPSAKVMQGYAYILTHPGIPMVFWDHYFDWGLKTEINNLIKIRKDNGLTATSSLNIVTAGGNLYAAIIDNKVAMKIGSGNWSPGAGWNLKTSGTDYAVWDKLSTTTTPPSNFTIYFKKPTTWSQAWIHYWGAVPASALSPCVWPCEQMAAHTLPGWFKKSFTGLTSVNVLFHNNAGLQTADQLNRTANGWFNGSVWTNTQPASRMTQETELIASPNPFEFKTSIDFSITTDQDVKLEIFDLSGRLVELLQDGNLEQGTHQFVFEKGDLPKGVYIYRLSTNEGTVSKKLILE